MQRLEHHDEVVGAGQGRVAASRDSANPLRRRAVAFARAIARLGGRDRSRPPSRAGCPARDRSADQPAPHQIGHAGRGLGAGARHLGHARRRPSRRTRPGPGAWAGRRPAWRRARSGRPSSKPALASLEAKSGLPARVPTRAVALGHASGPARVAQRRPRAPGSSDGLCVHRRCQHSRTRECAPSAATRRAAAASAGTGREPGVTPGGRCDPPPARSFGKDPRPPSARRAYGDALARATTARIRAP